MYSLTYIGRRTAIKVILSVLLIIANIICVAQNEYKFRLIDVSKGLSDDQIRSLSMTKDGRIAIRTASILNIYNGATFEQFPYDKELKYTWSYSRPPKEYYDNEGRMWLKELNYLLLLNLETNQFEYDIPTVLKNMGIKRKLINLFIDEKKNYWFVTDDQTVSFYDIQSDKLTVIENGNSTFTKQYGVPVEMTQYKNQCWIVYSSGLIRCWDYTSKEFILNDNKFIGAINHFTDRIYIHPDKEGNLWLMYNNGVFFFSRINNEWKEVAGIKGLSNFFTCMDIDQNGSIWVGTSKSGLRLINPKTFHIQNIPSLELIDGGTLDNDIYTIFVDRNNSLWIGTLFQGLCYYHPAMRKFQDGHTTSYSSFISNETTRCFLEEEDGNILIGNRFGLFRFNPINKKTEHIYANEINDLCLSLYRDHKGRIWAGTFLDGFYCIDNNNIKHFIRSSVNLEQDPNQNVSRAIYEDEQGKFWVSITNGVGRFDPGNGKILYMLGDKHPELKKYSLIYSLHYYKPNTFIALGDNGVFLYNTHTDKVEKLPEQRFNGKKLNTNIKIFCYIKDSRGLEWFGTEDGIRITRPDGQVINILTTKNGLPNNSISSLVEDNTGEVWASTYGGVCKINPKKENNGQYSFPIVSYDISDGLLRGKFYENAVLKTKAGLIFFGGAHGFNYFNPQKIIYNHNSNSPVLTSFYVFNTPIAVNQAYDNRIIWNKKDNKQTIRLKHNQNFFTIEFSGLNFVNPSHTYYKYKLQNFDKNWTETTCNGLGKATYTNIQPGEYKFILYTANSDKIWGKTPAELTIIIAPPFWATGYAIGFYIVIGIIIFILIIKKIKTNNQIKAIKAKEKAERLQKEELDQMKFRFFTNISHEFRTPLTLIMTPLGTLIKHEKDQELKRKLGFIYQNADRLLKLVNQLLDFRKLEMKGEKLTLKMNNIIEFIEDIYNQFKEIAANEGIAFEFITKTDHLFMNYDHDKLYKIINNLLSNAFKFTPRDGYIAIKIEKTPVNDREYIAISVRDTGCGIATKDIPLIFDRFYQTMNENGSKLNNGSGIGLHLVKEYVKLHEGMINVESEPGKGSTFTVLIPTDLKGEETENPTEENEWTATTEEDIKEEHEEEKKTILIVEDNDEFRMFLADQLKLEFNILEANDGKSGEELILSEYPDMIISDLMMPGIDGIELCRRVKNNIKTSHIPFILLTARSSDDIRMGGYEAGADSYISKPFNLDMLLARIRQLIEQQDKRKELFHKTIVISPSSITTTSLDEELVKRALVCVENNINNPDYSIEDLGRDVGLSKTHLNRKLQSITSLTPLQFIRSVRLKRAAQLLQNTQYNINEVADMVGFNTLKYFNKYFKDEFHMTPTQYREEFKDNNKH